MNWYGDTSPTTEKHYTWPRQALHTGTAVGVRAAPATCQADPELCNFTQIGHMASSFSRGSTTPSTTSLITWQEPETLPWPRPRVTRAHPHPQRHKHGGSAGLTSPGEAQCTLWPPHCLRSPRRLMQHPSWSKGFQHAGTSTHRPVNEPELTAIQLPKKTKKCRAQTLFCMGTEVV